MKTLFALGSGVVLGTIVALWLAARGDAHGGGGPTTASRPGGALPSAATATPAVTEPSTGSGETSA
jgi:hypothetical protein